MGFYRDLERGLGGEEYVLRQLLPRFPDLKRVRGQKGYDLIPPRIEVKTDYFSKKSGNLAFEYKYNDQPSGISTTEAEYWAHIYWDRDCVNMENGIVSMGMWLWVLCKVDELKRFLKDWDWNRADGGDYDRSEMILVPAWRMSTSNKPRLKQFGDKTVPYFYNFEINEILSEQG